MIKYKTRMSENLRSGLTVFDDRCYVRQIYTIALSTIKSITRAQRIVKCVLPGFVTKSVQLKKNLFLFCLFLRSINIGAFFLILLQNQFSARKVCLICFCNGKKSMGYLKTVIDLCMINLSESACLRLKGRVTARTVCTCVTRLFILIVYLQFCLAHNKCISSH